VHQQSTASWSRYFNARTGGAFDQKPRPKPKRTQVGMDAAGTKSFYDLYPEARRLAHDAEMERHGGNVIAPSGRPCPEVLEDSDPLPQHLVETDAEPTEAGYPSGRAPPWGKHDLPAQRSVTEPNPTLATDPPVSERQRKAMYSAVRGESKIGIPQSVGRHFIEDQIAAELPSEERHSAQSVAPGQQGEDQEEHADREQDEQLIGEHITRLVKALARDRARRRAAKDQPPTFSGRPSAPMGSEHAKLAGDRALSRGSSFYQLFPEAERLESHGSGAMLITARVFVHPSRG
jgi:hypothetical protein